jgi:hypothetical protein
MFEGDDEGSDIHYCPAVSDTSLLAEEKVEDARRLLRRDDAIIENGGQLTSLHRL